MIVHVIVTHGYFIICSMLHMFTFYFSIYDSAARQEPMVIVVVIVIVTATVTVAVIIIVSVNSNTSSNSDT